MISKLYPHIAKRIIELGYKDYHVHLFNITTNEKSLEYFYPAYNEYLFPVSPMPENTIIYSDIDIIEVNKNLHDKMRIFRELTGMIIIKLPQPIEHTFEFVRVIPQ